MQPIVAQPTVLGFAGIVLIFRQIEGLRIHLVKASRFGIPQGKGRAVVARTHHCPKAKISIAVKVQILQPCGDEGIVAARRFNRMIGKRLRQASILGGDIRAQNFILRGGLDLTRIHDGNGQQRRVLAYPGGKLHGLAQRRQGAQQQRKQQQAGKRSFHSQPLL